MNLHRQIVTSSSTSTSLWTFSSSTASSAATSSLASMYHTCVSQYQSAVANPHWVFRDDNGQSGPIKIRDGSPATIELPDGAVLEVDASGNYRINDANAQVVYRANRVREFNKYLNASDLLEEFIHYVGSLGVRQSQFMNLPVELFINWLIIRSAEADGDPVPDELRLDAHPALLPPPKEHLRCKHCGRFLPAKRKDQGLLFCNAEHMNAYAAKVGLE